MTFDQLLLALHGAIHDQMARHGADPGWSPDDDTARLIHEGLDNAAALYIAFYGLDNAPHAEAVH